MASPAEVTLVIMVVAVVLGGLAYVIYLTHTGKCGDSSASRGGGVLPNRTRRAQEDAALLEMAELKKMFVQMNTALEKKKQRQKKKAQASAAGIATDTDVVNPSSDGIEEVKHDVP